MLTQTIENEIRAQGYAAVCGIDEAGRGPLAGPVVAAAEAISVPIPSAVFPRGSAAGGMWKQNCR